MKESDYYIFFSCSTGVGPKTFLKLLTHFKTAENIYNSSEKELKNAGLLGKNLKKFLISKRNFDFNSYSLKLKKAKVEFIPYISKFYPEGLKQIDNPPIGLFIKGNKKLLVKKNNVAVVGARKITSYGREVTKQIVSYLSDQNIIITSGLAMGVDGIAHKTALDEKGSTIAVLGCGVDCPYPRENEKLYEEILDNNGLVISEYPLGMAASPGTFPARNRIIASLSRATLVTEAAEDSGSLITAEYALKYGKKLFAVPGPINSPMSRGALKLLKEGASLVSSGEDILKELRITNYELRKDTDKLTGLNLSKEEKKILQVIENEEFTVDQIARRTKISIGKLVVAITDLELRGIIKNDGGKIFLNF